MTRSSRWSTRTSYALLWGMVLAVVAGLALAVDQTVGLVVTVVLGVLLLWRLSRVGIDATGDDLVARTVITERHIPAHDIQSFFWRAPWYPGGARLSLRRTNGTEMRLPVMVTGPKAAAGVDAELCHFGVPVVPLVEHDLRRTTSEEGP